MTHANRQLVTDGILVVTSLSLAVCVGLSKCGRQREAPGIGEELLASTAAETCQWLSLNRGKTQIRMRRQGTRESWVAEQAGNPHGDSAAIERALAALMQTRVIRRLDNPGDLHRLGLEPPKFLWTMTNATQSWTIGFGGNVPGTREGTYVALSSAPNAPTRVFAANADLTALDLVPEKLIDPMLIRTRELDIREMKFESAQIRYDIRRNRSTERWFDVERPGLRLDADQTTELLNELGKLRSVSANEANLQLGNRSAFFGVLSLDTPSGETKIQFMGSCPQAPGLTLTRITQLDTNEYCTDTATLSRCMTEPLRHDTRLFTLRFDEVESVRVIAQGHANELMRDGTAFVLRQQGTTPITLEAGNRYLTDLLNTRGQFASAGQWSGTAFDTHDRIRLRSAVVARQDDYEETLLLATAAVAGGRLVRRLDDDAVLWIDQATSALLRLNESMLKHTSVPDADAGQPH